MVFFRRLRLRLREQRLDHKLREREATAGRREAARSSRKDLTTERIVIQPLRKTKKETIQHETETRLAEKDAALVEHCMLQRRSEFSEDERLLRALQRVVPSAKPHIDKWIERQRHYLDVRVRTDQDLAIWTHAQTTLRDELARIRDLTAAQLVACTPPIDLTVSTSGPRQSQKQASFSTPHIEVCVAMVLVALLFGAWGLLALAPGSSSCARSETNEQESNVNNGKSFFSTSQAQRPHPPHLPIQHGPHSSGASPFARAEL